MFDFARAAVLLGTWEDQRVNARSFPTDYDAGKLKMPPYPAFVDPRYLEWLLTTIKALEMRLARDIDTILVELSSTVPAGVLIELQTGADEWTWDN